MKKITIRCLLILLIGPLSSFVSRAQEDMGMNLGDPRSGLVFVDIIKDTRGFQRLEKVDGKTVPTNTDTAGWPQEDFALTCFDLRNARGNGSDTSPAQDPNPPRLDLDGVYKASFRGTAGSIRVKFNGTIENVLYDSTQNLTTFDIVYESPTEGRPFFSIELRDTQRNENAPLNSGITDLKILRPGYERGTSQVFTDVWLNAVAPFSIYRYMDWSETNGNAAFQNPEAETGPIELSWNQRRVAREGDATTIRNGAFEDRGLAWETIIDHINVTGKDAWINIPVHANDNYVRELARLFKNRLTVDIKLYVEYTNETWNFGFNFSQADWNFQKAVEEANGGGIIANGANGNDNLWAARRMAKRTVEIGQIFEQEGVGTIGNDLRPVLQYFASAPGNAAAGSPFLAMKAMVEFIEDNYGPANQYISAISRTGYFGASTIDDLPEGASVADILAAAEAGIPTDYQDFGDLATEKGLEFTVYEGAPGHKVNSQKNLQNRIRAERTAEMGDLIKQNFYDGFQANNGGTFMYFASHKFYQQSGFWGTTDIITDLNRDFKYRALLDIINGVPFDRKPIISTSSLGPGLVGETYSQEVRISGGNAPVSITKSAGSLPNGLSLSGNTISGTPTQVGSFNFTLRATDADGDQAAKDFSIFVGEVVDIQAISSAPNIDGSVDSQWNTLPEYTLSNVIRGSAVPSADFSVRFKTAWDTNALYYLITVTDQTLINDSEDVFQDDGAEVYLDVDNDKAEVYGANDYQIQLGYNDDGIEIGKGSPITNVQKAQSTTDDGYRIELAIPWSSLNTTVSEGTFIGFDVHAADDDDGGNRDTKISFNAIEDTSFNDPTSFGTGKLVGDGSEGPGDGDDVYFYIKQKASGDCLTPENANINAKIKVLPKEEGNALFLWRKVSVPNNSEYFYLENKATGLRFRPKKNSDVAPVRRSGAVMETKPVSLVGSLVQWKLQDIPNDKFGYLVNRGAGDFYVRPVDNENRDLVLRPTNFSFSQTRWIFEPAEEDDGTPSEDPDPEDEEGNGSCDATSPGSKPNPPCQVKVDVLSNSSVRLSWNDNSDNETFFDIQGRLSGDNFRGGGYPDAPANTTSIVIDGLQANATYEFRIKANANGIGSSAWVETNSVNLAASSSLQVNMPSMDSKTAFNFYPNPVTSELYILGLDQDGTYYIYDQYGKVVLSDKIKSRNASIDLSSLDNGIYFVQINKATFKVIVSH